MRLQEIQIRHLRSFATTAKFLNFRKAADSLNITQPALSRQIQQLEASLGFDLFERSTKSVHLKPAGHVLLECVERIIADIEIAATRAQLASKGKSGLLRIGVDDLSLFTFMSDTIYKFKKQYPEYEISMIEGPTSKLNQELILGNLDCTFTPGYSASSELKSRHLFRDTVMVVIHKSNPLSWQNSITINELKNQPLILFPRERNPDLYDHIMSILPQENKHTIRLASSRLMSIMMAATNAGIAPIGKSMTHLCPDSVKCVEVKNPEFYYDLYTVWRKGRNNPLDPFLPPTPKDICTNNTCPVGNQ